jgi:Do/DeqQ family serine protease
MPRNVFLALLLLLSSLLGSAAWAQKSPRASAPNPRLTFAPAVQKTAPSVVTIYTAKAVANPTAGNDFRTNPALTQMFDQSTKNRIQRSLGSGVLVGAKEYPSGLVITNGHVIQGASAIKVGLPDGREFPATLLGQDEKLDLAILKLTNTASEPLPTASFGNSDNLQVGDVVLALGNPFGLGQSVSFGVVSAVERSAAALSPYARFIQTDAPINPGNSGGALIDSTGAVVGINSGIFSRTGASIGVGFAIPSKLVQRVIADIASTGQVIRPWLGAEGQAISPRVAEQLALPGAQGVLLTAVIPGSPAALGGLQVGDVILRLAGQEISDPSSLNEYILSMPNLLNTPTSLLYWRSGKMLQARVTLTALPPRAITQQRTLSGYHPLVGHTFEPLSPGLNVELDLALPTVGVAIVAVPTQQPLPAFPLQFQVGDVILSINGHTVRTIAGLESALASSRQTWEISYQRQGQTRRVVVR